MTEPRPLMFFHIGKTSGTSVKMLLKNADVKWAGGRHLPAEVCRRKFGGIWESAEKFTIVRNPYDRFRSSLKQCRFAWNMHPNQVMCRAGHGGLALDLFRPMSDSLLVDGELPEGLTVFKFEEDVPHNVQSWLNERGVAGEMPHYRKRQKSEVKPMRDVQIEFIRKFYRQDFEIFGYDTDDLGVG